MSQPIQITRLSPATNLISVTGPYNLTAREVEIISKLECYHSDDEIRHIVGRDCYEAYCEAFYPNYNGVA